MVWWWREALTVAFLQFHQFAPNFVAFVLAVGFSIASFRHVDTVSVVARKFFFSAGCEGEDFRMVSLLTSIIIDDSPFMISVQQFDQVSPPFEPSSRITMNCMGENEALEPIHPSQMENVQLPIAF